MANTLKFGDGKWATGEGTALAFNDENDNFKPLPFTFTRASKATVVNQSGLIEEVGNDVPRIDFQGNTKGALLLEPQRSNLFPYSNNYTSGWSVANLTITQNAGISPENINNASKIIASSNGTFSYVYDQLTGGNSQYTISAFVKADGRNIVWLYIESGTSQGTIYFDLSDESMQVVSGTEGTPIGTITKMSNGWYRITHTSDTITLSSGSGIGISDSKGSPVTTTDGTNGVLIYGLQIEAGSYATSYIKTEGSAVTRVAETCEGADVSNIISNQGTLYIEFDYLKETFSSGQYIFALGTDSNNVIWLRKESGANTSTARIRTSSNNQYTESGIDIPTGINKYAVTFSTSGSTIYLNGTEIYSTTSSLTLPAFSTINFNLFSNSGDLFQETKDLRIYNTALTDQELASLTT